MEARDVGGRVSNNNEVMKPRLVSCYFDPPGGLPHWARMAKVLEYSARKFTDWDIDIRRIEFDESFRSAIGVRSLAYNTQKMQFWFDAVMAAADGAQMLLIDADTVILRSLDDVWESEFDYAYTIRHKSFPFNSGVVFVRVSQAVRDFFHVWRNENLRMLTDSAHHQKWRKAYGGINQAALGFALEHQLTSRLKLLQLECQEWNCEDTTWNNFDERTRILHVKSNLRRAIFVDPVFTPHLAGLIEWWKEMEREATVGRLYDTPGV